MLRQNFGLPPVAPAVYGSKELSCGDPGVILGAPSMIQFFSSEEPFAPDAARVSCALEESVSIAALPGSLPLPMPGTSCLLGNPAASRQAISRAVSTLLAQGKNLFFSVASTLFAGVGGLP